MYRNISVWVESNGDRVVGVSADVKNVGKGYICGLELAVDNFDRAVGAWPGWFPYKADSFAPGEGGTLKRREKI